MSAHRAIYRALLLVPGLLLALPALTAAQSTSEQGAPPTVALLQGTSLGIGTLIQVDGYVGRQTAPDGFALRATRLRLRGTTDRLRFFVQTDFNRTPSVLDARLRVPLSRTTSITAGLFKAPFSAELLLFRGDLLVLERSRVVNTLAPRRQLGVSLRTDLVAGRLRLEGGLFNGNGGGLRPNDNDAFLYVGRVSGAIPLAAGRLAVGANVAYSQDENVALGSITPSFAGQRWVLGLDARLHWRRWTLAAEGLTARLDAANGPATRPGGYYLTAGYDLAAQHQLRVRLDAFDSDHPAAADGAARDDTQVILGYAFAWTETVTMQINYLSSVEALDSGHVGGRLQLALH